MKPAISIQPSSKEMTLSSDRECLQLTCEAEGATSRHWEKQDGKMPLGTPGMNTTTLTLVNLTPEDSGNYRCAMNCFGEKAFSDYVTVTIHGTLTMLPYTVCRYLSYCKI